AADVRAVELQFPRHTRQQPSVFQRPRELRRCRLDARTFDAHWYQSWYQDCSLSRGKLKKILDAIWASEVRALRQAMGLNQEEFAVKMGIAKSTVGYWERGKFRPHRKTKERSEERRVGKECRTRGWRKSEKRKNRRRDDRP